MASAESYAPNQLQWVGFRKRPVRRNLFSDKVTPVRIGAVWGAPPCRRTRIGALFANDTDSRSPRG